MIFRTTDGRQVSVGISHREVTIPRYGDTKVRRTVMWLNTTAKNGSPIIIEEHVTCSPEDMFSRAIGRELVREKFMPVFELPISGRHNNYSRRLTAIKYEFNKDDRRIIYEALYPEFYSKKKLPKKQAYSRLEDKIDEPRGPIITGKPVFIDRSYLPRKDLPIKLAPQVALLNQGET